jgi:purine-binding chemotaxis protein CheW
MSAEVERILRERARELAREAGPVAETETRGEALVVRVGRARYAAPLARLAGVVALDALTPLPGAPSFVAGLAPVHGVVLTIVDLGVVLGEAASVPTRALLVEVDSEAFGLGVSGYDGVVAVPASGLAAPPPGLSETALRYVEGMIATSGLGVLRLEAIIADLCRDESKNEDGNQ